MTAIEEFEAASHRLVRECSASESMGLATGVFLGIVLSYLKHQGHDPSQKITVQDPNGNRSITIHAAEDTQ